MIWQVELRMFKTNFSKKNYNLNKGLLPNIAFFEFRPIYFAFAFLCWYFLSNLKNWLNWLSPVIVLPCVSYFVCILCGTCRYCKLFCQNICVLIHEQAYLFYPAWPDNLLLGIQVSTKESTRSKGKWFQTSSSLLKSHTTLS